MARWRTYKDLARINYNHHLHTMAKLQKENEPPKPMATSMTDETPMPFGKHKGKKMKHVPADYLLWMWDNGPELHKQNGGLADYVREHFTQLEQEAPDVIVTNRPDVRRKP